MMNKATTLEEGSRRQQKQDNILNMMTDGKDYKHDEDMIQERDEKECTIDSDRS